MVLKELDAPGIEGMFDITVPKNELTLNFGLGDHRNNRAVIDVCSLSRPEHYRVSDDARPAGDKSSCDQRYRYPQNAA